MKLVLGRTTTGWLTFAAFMAITVMVYAAGVHGGFMFDDFPNIVDNPGVQPADASLPSLVRSALSSPSSEFKRPLASLSFAANFLVSGTDPLPMKITNVVIHLLNGLLTFLCARLITRIALEKRGVADSSEGDISAACVAGAWMLLPINLTAVLYVVQRMESMANVFVLLGLFGYLRSRKAMQATPSNSLLLTAIAWIAIPSLLGLLAKETAVMLPLYAFVGDAVLFRFKSGSTDKATGGRADRRVLATFGVILWLPMILGLAWLLPSLLSPSGWSTRDFTMSTRLLTEARVVLDYLAWTILPSSNALSFYHDDLVISRGWLSPWTTLPSVIGIAAVASGTWLARNRWPLVTLGGALYLAAHLLTGTILPLELVYEHRNYFASFGVLLAIVPPLAQPKVFVESPTRSRLLRMIGPAAAMALLVFWAGMTALTSLAWNSPLSLARELASRAPDSPRAQYELGRTYIIVSRYDPASPFSTLAYAPLERAMGLPNAGVLPEQALIFFNSRMHRPIEAVWWDSMEQKLRANKVTVQDESALSALAQCDQTHQCQLPIQAMERVYLAALSHPERSPRLVANYGDFAWNQLGDRKLAVRMLKEAVAGKPGEPAYRLTLIRMLVALGSVDDARTQRRQLAAMNVGGALDGDIAALDNLLGK